MVKKPPIPMFPWSWIAHEIDYQNKNIPGFTPDQLKEKSKKEQDPIQKQILLYEIPQDDNQQSISLFKILSQKGANPNYIRAVLWHFCDPSYQYTAHTIASADKIKNLLDIIDVKADTYSDKKTIQATLETLKDIPSILQYSLDPKLLKRLKAIIKDVVQSYPLIDTDSMIATTSYQLKGKTDIKKGRSADMFFDLMLLLVCRHLQKKVKWKNGHKGTYSYLSELFSACFPTKFNPLPAKSMRTRINRLSESKKYNKECLAFEKKYMNIGKRLIERAKQENSYENTLKEWIE